MLFRSIAPSHLSVGIQFADLVAGAVFRSVTVGDKRFITQIETASDVLQMARLKGGGW